MINEYNLIMVDINYTSNKFIFPKLSRSKMI